MRILLLNEYFPPDTSATAHMAAAVAEALVERHEVTVLCGRPSYDPCERHPYYFFRREWRGKAAVERVGSTTFPRFRMIHRVSNYLSYVALAFPRALASRADLVVSMTDPPFAGIFGAVLARLKRKPFVYNIRDLYPEMAWLGDIVRSSQWVRVWERLHRWALRQASRVIVLGEDARERIIAKGVDPARVVVVRDGAQTTKRVMTSNHPVVQEIRGDFPFVVLHAGNLGFYGAWETVVKAAEILDGDSVGFVFIGGGALRSKIQAIANGARKVRFLPFFPPDQVPYVLAAGDLHLVTIKRGLEGVVVPSKLYSILAAGRPVLVLAAEESDAARVVRRMGCGEVADPDDPASFAALVQELARDRERLARMGECALQAAESFARDKELQLFRRIIEEAAPRIQDSRLNSEG
jgi:putative colanic acid biosynthesis glycosyltransferase WcaI